MLTMAASRPARARPVGGARSTIVAVATPVNTPADTPDSSRPANSAGRLSGIRNTRELAAAMPSPGSSTALRPTWSDNRPDQQQRGEHPTA